MALGGGQQIQKYCNGTAVSLAGMQQPVYDVEVYENNRWNVVDNIGDYHFRSATVTYGDKIYSFGGQAAYFSACVCHPAVDDILIFDLNDVGSSHHYSDSGFSTSSQQQDALSNQDPNAEQWGHEPTPYGFQDGVPADIYNMEHKHDAYGNHYDNTEDHGHSHGTYEQQYDRDDYYENEYNNNGDDDNEVSYDDYESDSQPSGYGSYQRSPVGSQASSFTVKWTACMAVLVLSTLFSLF